MAVILSGIQPLTLQDFPDKVACIAFIPGCNLRCGFCHNPEFVLPAAIKKIKCSFVAEEVFFNFLDMRHLVLEGVVVSGGEPTVMRSLPDFIRRIKSYGLLVKLDTNGCRYEMIETLLDDELVDYIAVDVKYRPDDYSLLYGTEHDALGLQKTIALVKSSGVDHEFRTTMIRDVHTPDVVDAIAHAVTGARAMYLQLFRPDHTLDPAFATAKPFSKTEMNNIAQRYFADKVGYVGVRA